MQGGRRPVSARRFLRRRSHAERVRTHRRADREAGDRAAHSRGRARHGLQQVRAQAQRSRDRHGAALRTTQHVRAAGGHATKRFCRSPNRYPARSFGSTISSARTSSTFAKSPKGPQVVLSRTAEGLVQRLLELEVPELRERRRRDHGDRARAGQSARRLRCAAIAPEVDPIGACLGPKSSRIANVSDNLRGEKIDVIRWAPDAQTFIMNALAPAKVISRRVVRGRRRCARHRSRLSAFARDRARRAKRTACRASDRMASRHHERNRSRRKP